MLNLDPGLLNQEAIRLARRKRLLKTMILPVCVFVLISIFFCRTALYNMVLASSEKSAEYGTAEIFNNLQFIGNLIEPYIPYYNRGYTTLIKAETKEDLEASADDFRESLRQNPPESMLCAIGGNLSYSIELQGDVEFSAGHYNDALVYYNQAEAVLYENGCASEKEGEKGSDEKSEAAKERIDTKRRTSITKANADNDSDSSDEKNQPQEATDEALEEVKKLNINNSPDKLEQMQERIRSKKASSKSGSSTIGL